MKISEYNNLMRKTTRPIMIISIRAEMRYQTGNIEIFSLTYCFNKKARSKSTYQEDRNRIIRNAKKELFKKCLDASADKYVSIIMYCIFSTQRNSWGHPKSRGL